VHDDDVVDTNAIEIALCLFCFTTRTVDPEKEVLNENDVFVSIRVIFFFFFLSIH